MAISDVLPSLQAIAFIVQLPVRCTEEVYLAEACDDGSVPFRV